MFLLQSQNFLMFLQVFGTILGIFLVDKIGRRKILIQSSIQTFIAELALGIVFAYSVDTDTVTLGSTPSIASISLVRSLLTTSHFNLHRHCFNNA